MVYTFWEFQNGKQVHTPEEKEELIFFSFWQLPRCGFQPWLLFRFTWNAIKKKIPTLGLSLDRLFKSKSLGEGPECLYIGKALGALQCSANHC